MPGLTTEQHEIYTPDLLERLKYIGCPNDCSGNGECKRGSTYIPKIYYLISENVMYSL